MFERYTEKARRVVFFARYEASQHGSPYIEAEHLLLGLFREDSALGRKVMRSDGSVDSIRRQIDARSTGRKKVSTSVDLPLSNESKRVLAYAAEEAERIANKHIGSEHLLLGLLREKDGFAAQLLNSSTPKAFFSTGHEKIYLSGRENSALVRRAKENWRSWKFMVSRGIAATFRHW